MDWRAYADATETSLDEIKDRLSLEWVISVQAGIPLEARGEKSVGICPFHDDTNPSLDVYADGKRWGCFSCGKDGDVFDFIGQYWGLDTFPARLEHAGVLLSSFDKDGEAWQRISAEETPVANLDDLAVEARAAWQAYETGTKYPVAQLLQAKGLDINPDWLHETWHVGVDDRLNVVAPYVALDGSFVSYKTRYAGSTGWYARKGGKLTALYGEHQLTEVPADEPVWIFEGETDTWLGSWLLRGRGVALGLPTGAHSAVRPEWVDLFRGRKVTIVFDSDQAGRSAARAWSQSLAGVAAELRVSWPDAGDLCESIDPYSVLHSGETIPDVIPFVTADARGRAYFRVNANGDVGAQVSNWVIVPHKRIIDTDINGKIISQGLEVSFTDAPDHKIRVDDKAFQSSKDLTAWANKHSRVWSGSGSVTSQAILSQMLAQTPFLGSERGVEVVGLHGWEGGGSPVFVLPEEAGGTIGSAIAAERWRYVPPSTGAADFSRYQLHEVPIAIGGDAWREWAAPAIVALLNLNDRSVMTVIVAWSAAAVGRSLMREFPPLGVFGGAESGKTTVVREVMKMLFGLDEEHNLTNTTPHGVRVWAAATNAIAVWFDEFRLGARKDTMDTARQTIRDSYTASASSRGGFGENKQDLHEAKASAPLIISGEEALEEKSHIDRVVAVALNEKNLDPGALRRLVEARGTSRDGWIGRAYIEWFVRELGADNLPQVRIADNRREQGEAVLEWGWSLFARFATDVCGVTADELGELDLSNVRGEREAAGEHPIADALDEAIQLGPREPGAGPEGLPVAWIIDPGSSTKQSLVAVRVRAFQQWAVRAGYQFPGGERSTRSWLKNRWSVDPREKVRYGGIAGGPGTEVKVQLLVGVVEDFGLHSSVGVV
ncbi:MAG: hypothetical protein DRQ40_03055 [Gammaproteobacteria bacterium]|nr:MAG: hypothetical protein DRQ40_03055 [Gammaproteobacteria bacterium]